MSKLYSSFVFLLIFIKCHNLLRFCYAKQKQMITFTAVNIAFN